MHTRLYYLLYLKHRDEEKFDKLRQANGDEILPEEMVEQSYQIYEPPAREDSQEHEDSLAIDGSLPEW